jgi:hypothetical protein
MNNKSVLDPQDMESAPLLNPPAYDAIIQPERSRIWRLFHRDDAIRAELPDIHPHPHPRASFGRRCLKCTLWTFMGFIIVTVIMGLLAYFVWLPNLLQITNDQLVPQLTAFNLFRVDDQGVHFTVACETDNPLIERSMRLADHLIVHVRETKWTVLTDTYVNGTSIGSFVVVNQLVTHATDVVMQDQTRVNATVSMGAFHRRYYRAVLETRDFPPTVPMTVRGNVTVELFNGNVVWTEPIDVTVNIPTGAFLISGSIDNGQIS